MFAKIALATAALAIGVSAQATAPQWGQCGGQGWTGATACPSGWVCTFSSAYYSQCLQGTAPPATTAPAGPTSTKPPTTTSGGSAPSGTATSGSLGPTLLTGNLWIRAVEAPNFHKYLQSSTSGTAGPAILGDYTTAAQFQLNNGQLEQQLPGGKVLYLTVNTSTASSSTYLSTSFSTTPATVGAFAWQGDGLTWTAPGISRQNIGAWLACGDTTVPGAFINLGAYAYLTPAGCADETLNYYNGATAVN